MPSLVLTSAANVKVRIDPEGAFEATFDTLLSTLATEASDAVERFCGREFLEKARTEYYDGTGTDTLQLRQGPLVSVASVNEVEYGNDGAGNRTETLTEIVEADRLESGLQSEQWMGPGYIVYPGSAFAKGKRNYKVVYTAGFGTDLSDLGNNGFDDLVSKVTSHVALMFNLRNMEGLANKTVGNDDLNSIPRSNIDAAFVRAFSPYKLAEVA